ncbi:XrtN system VIT domain-containing protein [Mucilaginibacter sp. AW1-3]
MKIKTLLQDGFTATGLALIIISAIVFACTIPVGQNDTMGVFFINYSFSLGYLLALGINSIVRQRWGFWQNKLQHTIIMLVLWFISAFALNRNMNVFDASVPWLCVYIIVAAVTLVLAVFYQAMGALSRYIFFFFLGSAAILFTYYAIYLVPLYGISAVALIAIGISMHSYITLFMLIATITVFIRALRDDKKIAWAFGAGALWPVLVCGVFLVQWNNTDQKINRVLNQYTLNEAKIPAWMVVSQKIDRSPIAERILKTGLVYHEVKLTGEWFWGDMPTRGFDVQKQHDPLVVIASLFCTRPNLDDQERIKILKSMYDSRHHAQERLWAGDELTTASIVSNVKLFPEYRMAYTEKTLTIKNNSDRSWQNQEAIYTFHLSEGSVVTSLSLWINGQEEKSRLTTKAKADSAYKQIVGVQNRDPSVIHWQEGNIITVRVFPCPVDENRKVRIGVTGPLKKDGDKLVYENIYFEGPEATRALETVQVAFSNKPAGLQLPGNFELTGKDVYQSERDYQPYWEISCKAPQLATNSFYFDNANYRVKDLQPQYSSFEPSVVYLDLNNAWSRDELQQVWDRTKTKTVYVYQNGLTRLNDENLDEVYKLAAQDNFSLFPLYHVTDPEHSLIISKSTVVAPNLQDLEGSAFAKKMDDYFKTPKQIRLYNIGDQLSPYLKALKELRVLNYENGTREQLFTELGKHRFLLSQESDSTVAVNHAQMLIQKTDVVSSGTAPDHLLRLFAYNDIMKKVSAGYFTNNYVQPDIIDEAERAYVVTPVSSLIVLETQKDYEQFNIAESKNSLKNASIKSSGSVPEPHEWLLIALFISIVLYLKFYTKKAGYEG